MSNIQPKNNLLVNAVLNIKFFSEVDAKKNKLHVTLHLRSHESVLVPKIS